MYRISKYNNNVWYAAGKIPVLGDDWLVIYTAGRLRVLVCLAGNDFTHIEGGLLPEPARRAR